MNIKRLSGGAFITVIWFLIIVFIFLFTGLEHPDSLNELGDFLAGIFAPIAFFWLILGYKQQGKQLEQNTKALEQQERALQLQIDEMRQGTKQQVELVQLQRQQLDEQHRTLEPRFIISQSKVNSPVYGSSTDPKIDINHNVVFVVINYTLDNLGGDAFNLRITHPKTNEIFEKISNVKASTSEEIRFELAQFQLDQLNQKKELEDSLDFFYECKNGRSVKYELLIHVYQTNHPFYGVNLFLKNVDL
jgi:type II secretory pathway pseudopilin PulG